MAIPGSDLLEEALSIIEPQSIDFVKFNGRTTDDTGIDVSTYDAPVTLTNVSVQPVPRKLYQQMGLEFKKDYITVYTSDDIFGVDRDTSGDQIIFNSGTYQVLDENDWRPVDGWRGVLCIRIK